MFREADCVLSPSVDLCSPICLWRWSASKRNIHCRQPCATVFQTSQPAVALASRPGYQGCSTTAARQPRPLTGQTIHRWPFRHEPRCCLNWQAFSELIALQAICDRRPPPHLSTHAIQGHTNSSARNANRAPALLLSPPSAAVCLPVCQQPPQEGQRPVRDRLQRLARVGFPWKVSEEKGLFEQAGVPFTLQWSMAYSIPINALTPASFTCTAQTLAATRSVGCWWRRPAGGAHPTTTSNWVNDQVTPPRGRRRGRSQGQVGRGRGRHGRPITCCLLGAQAGRASAADDITFVSSKKPVPPPPPLWLLRLDACGRVCPLHHPVPSAQRQHHLVLFRGFPRSVSANHLVWPGPNFVEKTPSNCRRGETPGFATLAEIKARLNSSRAIRWPNGARLYRGRIQRIRDAGHHDLQP